MIRHLELFDKIKQVFSAELGNALPSEVFREHALVISGDGKWITEFTSNRGALAEAVLGVDFPREAGPVMLEHYAPLHALKDIVTSSLLLLRPVSSYLHQDEFRTFAIEHHLDGYLAADKNGRAFFEDLAENLFFLSLTKPGNQNEPDLWKAFANEGKGACLQLSITPEPACDLRAIGYQRGKTAFRRINEELAKISVSYIPWTLSRICAFYLPQAYSYEDETRLLIKRHEGGINKAISDARGEAWPVQIAVSGTPAPDPWCRIELVGIRAGPRCTPDAVRAAIKGTAFEHIPIT